MIGLGETVTFRPHPGAHEYTGRVVGKTYEKQPLYTVEVGKERFDTREVRAQ